MLPTLDQLAASYDPKGPAGLGLTFDADCKTSAALALLDEASRARLAHQIQTVSGRGARVIAKAERLHSKATSFYSLMRALEASDHLDQGIPDSKVIDWLLKAIIASRVESSGIDSEVAELELISEMGAYTNSVGADSISTDFAAWMFVREQSTAAMFEALTKIINEGERSND